MKASELFRLTAMSALTEMQKMGQKFPITGETFDPFQGDAPGFTLKHQRAVSPASEQPRKTYHVQSAAASAREQASASKSDVVEAAEYEPPLQSAGPQTAGRPHTHTPLAGDLNARGMRRALVLSEILAPPLALRGRR